METEDDYYGLLGVALSQFLVSWCYHEHSVGVPWFGRDAGSSMSRKKHEGVVMVIEARTPRNNLFNRFVTPRVVST
jgi:hypothetical protein